MIPPQQFMTSGKTRWWFYTKSVSGTTLVQEHVWQKPPGHKGLVYVHLQGAGGAGGNGHTRASNLAKGGGGGGGSGGWSVIMLPSALLPDRLFLYLARGGVPGTSQQTSAVGFAPAGAGVNSLLLSQGAATNGGNGTASGGGSGGSAGAVGTLNQALTGLGWWISTAGLVGGGGGDDTGAAGSSVSWGTTGRYACGGGGGGGATATNFAGGAVTGLGPMPTLPGGLAGGGAGQHGWMANNATVNLDIPNAYMQFMTSGGSGGGTNTTAGTGGAGGDAGYGSGGGGGGAGVTGGAGGRGGDAFCIIGCIS